jgi:hypothetical protein
VGKRKRPEPRVDGLEGRTTKRVGRASLAFPGKWGGELRKDLSAVCCIGETLFLAADEGGSLERLVWDRKRERFGDHATFALKDLLPLKQGDDEEVDIEGLDIAPDGRALWLTGSHCQARGGLSKPETAEELPAWLAEIRPGPNRFLLARIPLEPGLDDGPPTPVARHGELEAASVPFTDGGSQLVELLREDDHLKHFLRANAPAKENGFDIEGLAVTGDRIFLGLRGPVLRGWAMMLEINPAGSSELKLDELPGDRRLYRKHFLGLDGLGIRDLMVHGQDLLILAGPTMDLDGPVYVYRWVDALKVDRETVVGAKELGRPMALPYGRGVDHAEGICFLPKAARDGDKDAQLLVLYDSPAAKRLKGDQILADIFPLGV